MASGAGTAYRPRIADAELRVCLAAAGAVVIKGPKACGKTRMAQQLAASTVLLDVDIAAANLLRFRLQIDSRRTGEPAFLAVVCGSGYGYQRADGVAVVPVGALGP